MSDWKRRTIDVPFEGLPPEMVSAINQHIAQYNLGPILADSLMAIQTDSEKAKREAVWHSGEVKHECYRDTSLAGVGSHRGQNKTHGALRAADQCHAAGLRPDTVRKDVSGSGIQVSGLFTDASEPGSAFIGLDDGAAGQKFREILIKAAQDAKK